MAVQSLEIGGFSRVVLTTCTILVFPGRLGTGVRARAHCTEQLCNHPGGGFTIPSRWAPLELGRMEGTLRPQSKPPMPGQPGMSPGPADLLLWGPGRVCWDWLLWESRGRAICLLLVFLKPELEPLGVVWTPSGAGPASVLWWWSDVGMGFCSCPAGGLWHRGAHAHVSPGNSWSEFSRCLARDESFKALGKEFETPPNFAENTYQMGGSQTASV